MMRWFGPADKKCPPRFGKRVEPPGPKARCAHCGECFTRQEAGVWITGGAYHLECAIRIIAGSVEHQLGVCGCGDRLGGIPLGVHREPKDRTIRENALAAYDVWETLQPK